MPLFLAFIRLPFELGACGILSLGSWGLTYLTVQVKVRLLEGSRTPGPVATALDAVVRALFDGVAAQRDTQWSVFEGQVGAAEALLNDASLLRVRMRRAAKWARTGLLPWFRTRLLPCTKECVLIAAAGVAHAYRFARHGAAAAAAAARARREAASNAASSVEVSKELAKAASSGTLSRDQILEVIDKTVAVQCKVHEQVSALVRGEEARQSGQKHERMPVLDAHKKILALSLPKEPLEALGLNDSEFQTMLLEYQEDEEVMVSARRLLHPIDKGDHKRAQDLTMEKIIEIHELMVEEMQTIVNEFLELPEDARRSFTEKSAETTAELLVSIAVERKMGIHSEDVELAILRDEEILQSNEQFMRCTDELSQLMIGLTAAIRPSAEDGTESQQRVVQAPESEKAHASEASALKETVAAQPASAAVDAAPSSTSQRSTTPPTRSEEEVAELCRALTGGDIQSAASSLAQASPAETAAAFAEAAEMLKAMQGSSATPTESATSASHPKRSKDFGKGLKGGFFNKPEKPSPA